MPSKFVVFMTYGVYVDTDEPLTEENYEELQGKIILKAIAKIQQATDTDLLNADFEIEDVTEEFA